MDGCGVECIEAPWLGDIRPANGKTAMPELSQPHMCDVRLKMHHTHMAQTRLARTLVRVLRITCRLMFIRSAKADVAAWAQHDPQYTGMC